MPLSCSVPSRTAPIPILAVGFGRWTRDRVLGPILSSPEPHIHVTVVTCLVDGVEEYRKVVKPYFYARGLPAPKYLPDIEHALDAVENASSRPVAVISTPNCLHAEQAFASLDRGYDVYVERPLATRLEDARELARLAEQRGVLLFSGTQRRMEATYGYVHDAVVARQDFDTLTTIRCGLSVGERPSGWRLRRELAGGGIVIDSGFHLLDCGAWIAADAGHHFSANSHRMVNLLGHDGTAAPDPVNPIEHSAAGDLITSSGLRLVFDLTYAAPVNSVYEYFDARDRHGARILVLRVRARRSPEPGRVTHQRADGSIVTALVGGKKIYLDNARVPGQANESGPLRALLESRKRPVFSSSAHACAARSSLPTLELIEEIYNYAE